jgi:hypothetical protein
MTPRLLLPSARKNFKCLCLCKRTPHTKIITTPTLPKSPPGATRADLVGKGNVRGNTYYTIFRAFFLDKNPPPRVEFIRQGGSNYALLVCFACNDDMQGDVHNLHHPMERDRLDAESNLCQLFALNLTPPLPS